MNREEVIALANKFDMRKGRRPRVSSTPRPTLSLIGNSAAAAAAHVPTNNLAAGTNGASIAHAKSLNSTPNFHPTTGAPQNVNVLSTRSEVEAAARLYDERLARASAYARKRRRDGKSGTAKHSSSSIHARSPASRSNTRREKKLQKDKAAKPAPIVTSFPTTKIEPTITPNPPSPSRSPPAANFANSHITSAVPVPQAESSSIISTISVPAPEAYSTSNLAENPPPDTYTPKPQDNANVNNPHHVITSASTTPLSTPNHDARNPATINVVLSTPNHSAQNIVPSYTNTHQSQVLDLPAYPTFPEQASTTFDAPIYGPHLQPDQYTPNHQQPQQQSSTLHYSQSHQGAQQEQNTIGYGEPLHPSSEQVASFNQEQQQANQIVSYEQQVIDNAQPNGVGAYGNDITPQSSNDAFVQSTVEYEQAVEQNTFGQNSTFGDGQTEVDGTNPEFTDVANGSSAVEAFQDNSFEGTNVVFEGSANGYEEEHNGTSGETYGDGDPVAVEQTAQVEGGEDYDQNEHSTAPNGAVNGVNGNGLVQEATTVDSTTDNTCYETGIVAAGPQLFHEYPPGEFDGDGEYAHLIPPPPEPEEPADEHMEWNTGTGTSTSPVTVPGNVFEEDTLGELDVPAKKRRFVGLHLFGQEKRSKIFEQNE